MILWCIGLVLVAIALIICCVRTFRSHHRFSTAVIGLALAGIVLMIIDTLINR